MKTASAATIAILAGNQAMWADLFTITLVNGSILRYTNGDGPLTYSGNTYTNTPLIKRSGTKLKVGIEVDSISITIWPKSSDLVSGLPFPQFVANGGFDGAIIQVDRCFMTTYGDTSAGIVNVFTGAVSDVAPSRNEILLTVSSDLQLLNILMPRNTYQPGCTHTLYDSGCGAVKATFGSASTVNSGSTTSQINCGLAQASGWFDGGTITFTSGVNSGVSRTVKSYTTGVLLVTLPLPNVPAVSDAFTAYAGCDKSKDTCINKFNRLVSFRGMPYVPTPETSI